MNERLPLEKKGGREGQINTNNNATLHTPIRISLFFERWWQTLILARWWRCCVLFIVVFLL